MDFFLPQLKCLVSTYVVNLRTLVPTKSSVLFKTESHWKTLYSILFTCKTSNPKLHYFLTSYSKFQSLLVEIGWWQKCAILFSFCCISWSKVPKLSLHESQNSFILQHCAPRKTWEIQAAAQNLFVLMKPGNTAL